MNTEKLKEGMKVKNYKELCLLLGEPSKTGKSKQLQIKDMERFFEYEKDKYSFIITKVYSENEIVEKEIVKGRKSIYGNIIQVLLMDILSKNKGNIIVSRTSLTKQLGLVNENYNIGYNNQLDLSRYLNIGIKYVNDFYNVNNANLNSIVNTALNSLHAKRIIDYSIVTMVKYSNERTAHVATPFDRAILTEIDKECMIEFGIKSLEELEKYNLNSRYFELLKRREQLIKSRTNMEYHYKAYDIVINHKYIQQEKNELADYILEEMERLSKLKELNTLYVDKNIINAEKRNIKELNKNSIRSNYDYIEYFKQLVKELLELNADVITFKELKNSNNIIITDEDTPF